MEFIGSDNFQLLWMKALHNSLSILREIYAQKSTGR